eukprot:scaffold116_cov334-Pavlova_lutheri.AAC.46
MVLRSMWSSVWWCLDPTDSTMALLCGCGGGVQSRWRLVGSHRQWRAAMGTNAGDRTRRLRWTRRGGWRDGSHRWRKMEMGSKGVMKRDGREVERKGIM